MTPVQIILIIVLVALMLYAYSERKLATIDPILITLMFGGGVAMVFFPNITTRIANALGVGRGADLLFYLAILGFLFLILKLYLRVRKLESRIDELVRKDSIDKALGPDDPAEWSRHNGQRGHIQTNLPGAKASDD